MDKKVYLWALKERQSQYGAFFTWYLNLNELQKYANEKGYVNCVVFKNKMEDKFWNSHAVLLSEQKPQEEAKEEKLFTAPKLKTEEINIEDIPFN